MTGDALSRLRVRFFTGEQLYPSVLVLICVVLALIRFWSVPMTHSDGYVWLPMTRDFFGVAGISEGRSRPLFGFVGYVLFRFLHYREAELLSAPQTWELMHFAFYIAMTLAAYTAGKWLTNSSPQAFFFAVMVPTSYQVWVWMSHTLPNVEGFATIYFSLLMLLDYDREQRVGHKHSKLVWYSLLYGMLMLGKGQYNILVAVVAFVLIFRRQHTREVILAAAIQFIPLIVWAGLLTWLGNGYFVYEVNRSDYSIVGYWTSRFGSLQTFPNIFALPDAIGVVKGGMGIIMAAFLLYGIGGCSKKPYNELTPVYFFVTAAFLTIVNFHMLRHAFDYSPIIFLAVAEVVEGLRLRVSSPRVFWSAYGVLLLVWALFNMNLLPVYFVGIV